MTTDGTEKKIVKTIKIDMDKCSGCRVCEMICSAFHAAPKYSSCNPARARIRITRDPITDKFVPVFAGAHTPAECPGRDKYTIHGKDYDECTFCRAACPSREDFKEPDSGLPLKCDRCEGEAEPQCVKWCYFGALTYEEREEEVEKEKAVTTGEMELAFDLLIKKYGKKKIMDAFTRLAKS